MSDETKLSGCTVSRSPSIAALAKALAAAQVEMHNPVKDTPNTFFRSLYADLAAVRDAVIPVLGKHKLSVTQLLTEAATGPACMTILMHESGEYIETTMLLRPGKQDPQGIGSASTYCRRYQLQSIAGVAAEADDDGNHASVHTNGNGHKPAAKPVPVDEPPADGELVAELEASLRACETAVEVEAARQILSLKKPQLTTAGAKHLAGVLKQMQTKTATESK